MKRKRISSLQAMAKQNQASEAKSDKKSRPKVEPTVVEELTDGLVGLAQLPGGPIAAVGDGTIEAQAAWLGDLRLPSTQRQALAAQIGRVGGNQHLQRIVASVKSDEKATVLPGAQGGLPNHAITQPPRQTAMSQGQRHYGKAFVQRQSPDHRMQLQAHSVTSGVVQRRLGQRQLRGIQVAVSLCRDINNAGREFGVPPELIGVIVMHESQARERAIFVLDALADAAERLQVEIQGESASIGIGQMRVGTARRLRQRYPALRGADSVVDDLLNRRQAVRYVGAHLRDIKRRLDAFLAAENVTLSQQEEMDMLALAYNIGWATLRDRNLRDPNFGADIPARVTTIRGRSRYLRYTTAHLALMRLILMRAVVVHAGARP